jgi:hypothetical protein
MRRGLVVLVYENWFGSAVEGLPCKTANLVAHFYPESVVVGGFACAGTYSS